MITLDDYVALFPPVTRNKSRFMALASAVLSQAIDLINLAQTGFPEAWNVDQAVGTQLDALGAILNVPRPQPTTSDDDYRFLLKAKIAVHHWNGTNETLSEILEAAFPGMEAKMIDNMDGTITVSLNGTVPFDLDDLFPVPAGIRMITS